MIRFVFAAALLLSSSAATFADLIIEARETGGDVVFTTSGSLDLTGWTKTTTSGPAFPLLFPIAGRISFGTSGGSDSYSFGSVVGPGSFGIGFAGTPGFNSGEFAFIANDFVLGSNVVVEPGYQFGDPIEATMKVEGATIDSLGINPGDTVWSWSTEPASLDVSPISLAMESITFRAIAIPEPSAFACLGLIGLVAGGRSWWKRR